jgi:hypothetical protein
MSAKQIRPFHVAVVFYCHVGFVQRWLVPISPNFAMKNPVLFAPCSRISTYSSAGAKDRIFCRYVLLNGCYRKLTMIDPQSSCLLTE